MKKNDEATKKEGVSWTFDTPSFLIYLYSIPQKTYSLLEEA